MIMMSRKLHVFFLLVIGILSNSPYPLFAQINLNNGLVVHLQMNGNTNDASTFANHGSPTNVSLSNDEFGNANSAYNFPVGQISDIAVVDAASLNFTTNRQVTISMFVNHLGNISREVLCGKWGPGASTDDEFQFTIDGATNRLVFFAPTVAGRTDVYSKKIIPVGECTHVVAIWDDAVGRVHLYINGIRDTTLSTGLKRNIRNTAEPIYMGRNGSAFLGEQFYGEMDNVRIYNRAINAAEALEIFVPQPITTNGSGCIGVSIPITSTGRAVKWYTDTLCTTLVDTGNTINITKVTAGTYYYWATQSRKGVRSRSAKTRIIVYPAFTIDVGADTIRKCELDLSPTTISATPVSNYTFLWLDGKTTSSITTNFEGKYRVIATDTSGCKAADSSYYLIRKNSFSIIGDSVICNYNFINLFANKVYSSYLWSTTSTASTINASPTIITTYKLTVTDAFTCTATDTIRVKVNTLPVVALSGSTSVLNGAIGNVYRINNPLGFTTNWTTTNTQSFTNLTDSIRVNWGLTGTSGKIKVVTTNPITLCSYTDSLNITLASAPPLNLTICSTNGTCFGSNDGSIDITTITGGVPFSVGSPYRIYWSNGDSAVLSQSSLSPGSYSVIIIDSKGIKDSATVVISQPLAISTTIDTALITCNTSSATLLVTVSNGISPYTYKWNDNSTDSTFSSSTIGNYSVSITDNMGCTSSATGYINQNLFVLNISIGADTIRQCEYNVSPVIYTVSPAGAYTYSWQNGSTESSFTASVAGQYKVQVTTIGGCIGIDSSVYHIQNNSLKITGDSVACIGDEILLQASNKDFTSYLWNTGGTNAQVVLIPLSGQEYRLIITDKYGCTKEDSIDVAVYSLPSINLTGPDTVMNDESNIRYYAGNSGFVNTWTVSGALSHISSNDSVIIHWPLIGSMGQIKMNATNTTTGCQTSDSMAITIVPYPQINIALNGKDINCNNAKDGVINISTLSGGIPYSSGSPYKISWSTGDTACNSIDSLSPGRYYVTIIDSRGKTDTASALITEPLAITISIDTAIISCNVSNATLNPVITNAMAPYTYLWQDNSTVTSFTSANTGNYGLTINDNNGCFAFATGIIKKNLTMLSVDIGTDTIRQCMQSISPVFYMVSPVGTYNYLWQDGSTNSFFNAVLPGKYKVTVTSAGGCTGVDSSIYIIRSNMAKIIGDSLVCDGASVTLKMNQTFNQYMWNTFATTAQITVIPSNNIKYFVAAKDQYDCVHSDSIQIVVNNLPTINITGPDTVYCGDTNIIYHSGTNLTINAWMITGHNTFILSNDSVKVNWPSIGTSAQVKVRASGIITDYTASDSIQIVLRTATSISIFLTKNDTRCFGFNGGKIQIDSIRGGVPFKSKPYFYKFLWSTGDTSVTQIDSLYSGNYTITVEDSRGQKAIANVHIRSPAMIHISFDSTAITCTKNTGQITPHVAGGTKPYTYFWQNASSDSILSSNVEGKYTLTLTDNNACTESRSSHIMKYPGLISISIGPDTIHQCKESVSPVTFAPTPIGTYYYLWQNGSTTNTYTASNPGKYVLKVSNISGCTGSDSTVIAVHENKIQIMGDTTICSDDAGDLIVNTINQVNYIWNTGATSASIHILNPIVSTFYRVIAINKYNCIAKDSTQFVIYTKPVATISGPNLAYYGDTNIGYTSVIASNLKKIWTLVGDSSFINNTDSIKVSWPTNPSQNGDIQLLVQNTISGCWAFSSQTVTLIPHAIVTINIILTSTNSKCFHSDDGQIQIQNITGGTPYTKGNGYKLFWSTGDTISTLSNLGTGSYSITAVDSIGNSGSKTISISEPSSLVVTVNNASIICAGEYGNLIANTTGGSPNYKYQWSTGSREMFLITNQANNYMLTVTDANSCTNTAIASLIDKVRYFPVNPVLVQPTCNTTPDGSIQLHLDSLHRFADIKWSNNTSQLENLNLASGLYSYTITDTSGCRILGSISLSSERSYCFRIPTAFSPNGDGINEKWMLQEVFYYYPNAQAFVYDRYGVAVYHGDKYTPLWDGHVKSIRSIVESYHFIIEFNDGSTRAVTGQVTVFSKSGYR